MYREGRRERETQRGVERIADIEGNKERDREEKTDRGTAQEGHREGINQLKCV